MRFFTKGRGTNRTVVPIHQSVNKPVIVKYAGLGKVASSKAYLTRIVKDDEELEYLSDLHNDMQFINKTRNLKANVVRVVGEREYDRWVRLYKNIDSGDFDFGDYVRRNKVHKSLWGHIHMSNVDKFEAVLRHEGHSREVISDFGAIYHYYFVYHDMDGVERGKYDHVANLLYPAVKKYLDIDMIDKERPYFDISSERRKELHEAFLREYHNKYSSRRGYLRLDLDPSVGTAERTAEDDEFDATMYAGAIAGGGI